MDERQTTKPRRPGMPLAGGRAVALGTEFVVGMAVFSMIGYWLDRRSGGGIFWTVCGMCMGLVYICYETWKTVRSMEQSSDAGERKT